MTAASWVDCSADPIWRVRLPRDYTPQEFSEQFTILTERLRKSSSKVGIVIDVNLLRRSSPNNRERASQFFRGEKELVKRTVAAWAFVTTNSVMRGAIAAIGWAGAFPVPTKTFDTSHAAERWLSEKLSK